MQILSLQLGADIMASTLTNSSVPEMFGAQQSFHGK